MGKIRRCGKVSEQQKEQIKALAADGLNKRQVAGKVNLSPATVYSICKKNGWELKRLKRKRKQTGSQRVVNKPGKNAKAQLDKSLLCLSECYSALDVGYLSQGTVGMIVRSLYESGRLDGTPLKSLLDAVREQ